MPTHIDKGKEKRDNGYYPHKEDQNFLRCIKSKEGYWQNQEAKEGPLAYNTGRKRISDRQWQCHRIYHMENSRICRRCLSIGGRNNLQYTNYAAENNQA